MQNNSVVLEERRVGEFTRVALTGDGRVEVSQGNVCSLTVEAAEDVLPLVTSEVRDGELVLGVRREGPGGRLRRKRLDVRFRVTLVSVSGLTLSGAGRMDAPSIVAGSLSLVVSGAGALEVGRLGARSLDVVLSGRGSCEVAGKVGTQRIRLSGAGSYVAPDLESAAAKVVVSGSGDAVIRVRDTLDARVSGTGSVRYHGAPTVRQRVTGVGCVVCTCTD